MLLKIKQLRNEKKLSQDELSAKTGISKRMLIDYEKENTDIPVKKLQLIATALEVDIFDLFNQSKRYKIDTINDNFEKVSEPVATYEMTTTILKDYNQHLKDQVLQLERDKDLLVRIIESKL